MSSASSSRSALRRRGPIIPHIPCPECGRTVVVKTSGTDRHKGWIFYKCEMHGRGCNFFHWEMEYVHFLVETNYLTGANAVEAVGWAEDRREELELRQQERVATLPGQDQVVVKMLTNVVHLLEQACMLLKMVIALFVFVGVVAAGVLYLKK